MLAALDTSTRFAGVALYDERGLVAETNWLAGSNHTVQLLPALEGLLAVHNAEVSGLRAVGVALGPGSFNGLRVAASVAKGLCLGLGIPFLGVGKLAATAYGHRLAGEQVCALVDAGRGQLHGALFSPGEMEWLAEGTVGILPLAQLLERIDRPTLFCGEVDVRAAEVIGERLGSLARVASPALGARRAAWLAEMAWNRYRAGESDDPAAAQPIYLRRPEGQPTG